MHTCFALLALSLLISIPHAQAGTAASPGDVVDAVNRLRAAYGLAPYNVSPILMATAQNQADYMAASGAVSHTGAGGSSVTDRLLAAGYPLAGELSLGGFRSENITSGPDGMAAQSVVEQWASDPVHLTTMISPDLTEIGAGVSVTAGRAYFVIDCARPAGTTRAEGPAAASPGSGAVIVPVVLSTPNASGELVHEVRAGQSLWQIAIAYNTTIAEIKRLNNLIDDNIYPGTKLLIKTNVSMPPLSVTAAATRFPTSTPAAGNALRAPALTSMAPDDPATDPPKNIAGYLIGIILIAFVAGGIFAVLGRAQE